MRKIAVMACFCAALAIGPPAFAAVPMDPGRLNAPVARNMFIASTAGAATIAAGSICSTRALIDRASLAQSGDRPASGTLVPSLSKTSATDRNAAGADSS